MRSGAGGRCRDANNASGIHAPDASSGNALRFQLVIKRNFRFQYLRNRASCFCFLDDAVKGRGINTSTATSLFSAIFVIAKPASTLSSDTSAVVSIDVGVNPASPSINESAIEKHAACAAPISSSGLVPFSPSKRVLNPYGCWFSTPLSVDTVPLPRLISPSPVCLTFLMDCHCCSPVGLKRKL